MSIGVDFIFRANSGAFTKAVASVNNSMKDLKKSFREFDVGNGLKQALGVGGIIAGFRAAITNAQELRDEARKLGREIDDGTRSVAEYGDALEGIWKGFKNGLTAGLSFFTRMGDGMRHFFQSVTQEQEDAARKMVDVTGKAADEAEARLKKAREDNSPEKQAAAQEKLDKITAASQAKGTDHEKKLVNLINERNALEEKLSKTGKATVAYKEIQAQILQNEMDTKEAVGALDEDRNKKAMKELKLAEESDRQLQKKQDDIREKFAPSVEQLAEMNAGGFASEKDPRIIAKRILEKEKFAAEAGNRGDLKAAMQLGTEAQSMREGLKNISGNGTALTAQTAETAMKAALEQTNKELAEVKEAMAGIIKAQK